MLDLSGVPMLDVAIGLAFMYFLLSIVCSSIGETIASVLGLRAKNLEQGIRSMLGDKDKANDFLEDWRIVRLRKPKRKGESEQAIAGKRNPSYIDPRTAALVLLDTLAPDLGAEAQKATACPRRGNVKDGLVKLLAGAPNVDAQRAVAERHFNDVMDRAAGWYKRRMQVILFLVALAVAVTLNADTVNVADRLARDEPLRAQVVRQAEEAASKAAPADGKTAKEVKQRIDTARATALPLGWAKENQPHGDGWWLVPSILLKVVGLVATAFALALGAPFWFDLLGRFANLRGTGNRIGTPKDDALAPDDRDARPVPRTVIREVHE